MATLSLRISIPEKNATKMMQFDPSTSVYDACRIIREKLAEASNMGQPKDYGLFLSDEDVKKGVWLEPGRNLDYYILRNGDLLEYRRKLRTLRVRMLDGTLKTMLVDDSQPVANLMVVICTKIGITNHDEYSLVRELVDEETENQKPGNFGTLTLKRRKEEKGERDAKMDQLRKKLKTDDEVNWIDPSKTLREQGIDEAETVLLRRKFFFSDQNIDSRDPVQLSLLYVQARDAILDGTHPITQEKACVFAGIQCQIQFGDHKEEKHKPGFLDLKEFLPQSYVKTKGIEKKVYAEHKKHIGLSELEAKVLYTKTARSLNTYGVTFFLVKEKMKGKNKLVPRLLGVTKDSVLRLDEKTKEILKTWPLTTVRRWGASPNTFTLDFGDYSDQYYSVQTTEAEQILQLIAGYIDIILKKQKAKDHFGIEGDEGSTMVEDSVSPLKATIMQHETSNVGKGNVEAVSVAIPAVMRAGGDGARPYGTGHVGGAQYTTVSGQVNIAHAPPMVQQTKVTSVLSEPQRALLSTITAGHEVIHIAETELSTKAQRPQLGTDPASLRWIEQTIDTHKQNVGSQIAAMNAATAQVVTLTSGPADNVDHTAVGAAITTIATNLPEMTKGVRMIAALMDDESSGERLLDAARKLCTAFSDLLKATEPETKEPFYITSTLYGQYPRQNLLNAASRVGEASHQVLTTIGEEDDSNRELQDMLLALAKAVANTTAALVLKAKNIAATCEDSATQNKVISAATQCALATSQLVACAKVVAPTMHSPACQTQLMNAVREVTRAVESLVQVCNETCSDENLLKELSVAASEVSRILNDLLNHIKTATRGERAKESIQEGAVETILVATDKLFASTGDAGEMVRQARVLGQATAQLIQSIKGEAEKQTDSEQQQRLLAAAKLLADATAKMVEAARQCASCPHDAKIQDRLRQAAEELRAATTAAATPALRRKLITRLEACAKQAAATATQCIAASSGVAHHNTNPASQEELNMECRMMAQHIPHLVSGVKGTQALPDVPTAQLNLINASEQFLQPGTAVVKATRAVLPTVTDQASAMQLNDSSQQLGSSLADLRSAVTRAREACGGLELDAAEELINSLKDELGEFYRAVEAASLRPLPEETTESTALRLGATSKNVGFAMAQLLSAAKQGNENYTGSAARETATALKDLTYAVRGVAATSDQPETQKKVLMTADDVIMRSLCLVKEARRVLKNPENPENEANLAAVAKDVSNSLNKCVSCLPGQRDVDEAIRNIDDMTQVLSMNEFPHTSKSYGQLQSDLNNAAASLNDASSNIASSVRSPVLLANSSKQFTNAFGDLLGVGMEMAGQTTIETRSQVVVSLKNVSMTSSKLLVTAKSVAADPTAPNAKNQLSAAARAVTDSINYLVDVCTSAAPGQNECDNAIRNIQSMRSLLDNPNEPISDASYFECLETVMEKSKSLGDGMTGIANHAKKSEHEQFSVAVRGVSSSICGLIEAAAQAAYLAGVSDPTSVAGKPGLVDQAQFFRAAQAIHTGCQSLGNPTSTQQQVLSAATMIAKHTSALCNACRVASSKTSNPVAKRHFVQSAKDVANSTACLVKEIKALDQNYSDINREKCAEATKPLLEAVDNLCTFASSPEFASQPAKISIAAKAAQEPITSAGKSIIDGSCAMVLAAKSLAVSPKDPPTWQLLANHSKSVSDSIKSLVASIRDKAPGQKECDAAIEKLAARIRELDAASLSAVSQALVPRRENTMQGFTDQMESSASELREKLEPLRTAAKYEAENVGHAVNQIALYSEPLVSGAIGAASNMVHSKQQMVLLDQTKTVAESALQLIYVTKESAGNPKAIALHSEVDETVESTKDALQELQNTLETISTSHGIVTGLIDTISRAMVRLEDHRMSTIDTVDSYVDYQTRMVEAAKEIARLAQEMSTKSSTDVARLGPLAVDISHKYTQLARDTSGASAAASNADVSARLRTGVQELGRACADIVRAAGICQMSPGDVYAQREVAEHSKIVTEKVSQVLAALQAGSRGTQACINAASTVSGIIGDLDTTIMFATAGTLHAENEGDTFADHRENILKTAKALVEDTKTLVAGAASSQEQLAVAAQNAVSTIVQLAEVVKYGAASLGSQNPEAQVMLINAVKDVASALGDLIHATKAASGKPINDPSMAHLKDSAKVMVTNVTSLLKTVKAVEDEHTRGTRALESTIEAIAQEIRALNSPETHKSNVTPEDLVRCTKSITISTAKAVAAGNSCKQDDIIAAANMGRKSISDMLTICKGAAYNCAETAELRDRTLQAGHDVAINYRELLQAILQISSRQGDAKHTLPVISRKIAQSVTELVAVAELLKGNDWVDPDDPTVIAENELLGAAASIDAAAKKLASLRPRRSIQEANEDMNFDEMILEAAKSIAAATSALIKAASAAQRELIATGKVSRTPLTSSDDGQWSEGLISAARLVAAATHSLVESANALVQGVSSEEKLISSAKQVASSTAQLLVACKVKADPDSESTKRLQAAGNAVKRATDNLVRAAQQAIQQEEDRSLVLNRRMVGGIAQEINARSEVLRIERELEEARGRLTAIRQAKYKNRPDLADADGDIDQSGYESYTTRYETRAYEPPHAQSPVQAMHHTLDQLQSTTQHISHHQFADSDRQQLVSPEKVHSTQSTLERKMKDAQYRTAILESQVDSLDRKYSDSYHDRSPYIVTERKIITDNSPGQYSSIERKINQESFTSAERKHSGDIAYHPPPQHISYSPRSPTRRSVPQTSPEQYERSPQDQQSLTDRFSTVSPMSTFRSEKQIDTQRFGTAAMPHHQTFKNVESKVVPGGRIETITTKVYTSTPKNTGTSSNYETTEETKEYSTSGNELSTFKTAFDNDTLEERTTKQSTLHKVTEKKTVTMTMSSRQESNTKTFRFEDKQ
ncbi:talin-1 isoform X4 [Odontomachus brunneus]|nr:talin-1 isoform X4 [Odontomachus brunneus]XP_032666459.1 talin-1 isoform X4 [Odontomachus brunneus]XP_032666460.1 talin-1 isoform X4 [Odontomachus brunneus]XP_032666461.1 talin-1 isoform X4 [Odontomachus brunneus]XP_032666463.1 talin-1 isoform X4 [Odontomachus brunneus]XP_032666464.1 talin-1 isoform X4 [Odontomachus brunneus]